MLTASTPAAEFASADPDRLTRTAHEAIETARAALDRIRSGALAGEELLTAYDDATATLTNARCVAVLVSKAHPDPTMRTVADTADQQLAKVITETSLDRPVYEALSAVEIPDPDPATQHWLDRILRDFRRAGVDRDEATREQIQRLEQELVSAGQEFARNINSDTREVRLPAEALAGLPEDWRHTHPPAEDGLVTITTDTPDVVPFLTYAHDSAAREQLLRYWRQRGYPANERPLATMLAIRHQLANLLGYPNWAAYITEDKMIGTERAAAEFIAEISAAAQARMERDYQTLLARKQVDDPGATSVAAWDHRYLTEQVKRDQYAVDAQAVRPYLEYERVKAGVMALSEELFGIRFVACPQAAVWHPEVVAYEVWEADQLLGRIFLDMHPRPDKFSHAAMFPMVTGQAGRRVPECALMCNFPRPGQTPALLEPGDARTFFHEFGHLLHHIFAGQQRWSGNSGIRTERDFVEAPSQLLEEWMRDPATLARFAVHHETGEPLPAALAEALQAAEGFGQGVWVRQQMFYAALSLELYRRDPTGPDLAAVEREIELAYAPFAPVDGAHQRLSFGHLEGYSATYYTYMWSLVIAKDLFTGFDPGALADPAPAARYRATVLAPGGSAPAAQLVRDFLGRDYTFDAFRSWLDAG